MRINQERRATDMEWSLHQLIKIAVLYDLKDGERGRMNAYHLADIMKILIECDTFVSLCS